MTQPTPVDTFAAAVRKLRPHGKTGEPIVTVQLAPAAVEGIAEAIARSDSGSWGTELEAMAPYWRKGYLAYADAVLAELRRMADCHECSTGAPHTVHCPTPETHNWGCGCPTDQAPESVARRLADEAQQQTEPACPDPIECGHEAALGQAEAKLEAVHALGQAWSRPTMTSPTRLAGEHLLRLLAATPDALDAQTAVVAAEAGEVEAHPPTCTWKVESPRLNRWASWGATHDERVWAAASYDDAIENASGRPFRLVRATTTYTVEAEHDPTAASQPGKEA